MKKYYALDIVLGGNYIGEYTVENAKNTGFYVREKSYIGSKFHPAHKVVRVKDGSSTIPIERDAIGRIILYQKERSGRNNNTGIFKLLDMRLDKP